MHAALIIALTASSDPPSSHGDIYIFQFFHLSEARALTVFDVYFCSSPATDHHFRFPDVDF